MLIIKRLLIDHRIILPRSARPLREVGRTHVVATAQDSVRCALLVRGEQCLSCARVRATQAAQGIASAADAYHRRSPTTACRRPDGAAFRV